MPFFAVIPGIFGAAVLPGLAARDAADPVADRNALGAKIRVTTTVDAACRDVVLSFSSKRFPHCARGVPCLQQ